MKEAVFGLIVGALIFIPLERVFALRQTEDLSPRLAY
jgi:hypothetical protein